MNSDQHELMVGVMRIAGGQPVEDALPSGYAGKRADILFAADAVVAEIKTLTTDRATDPKTADALGLMFSENHDLGAPIIFGSATVRLHDLPRKVAEKALRIVGKRVQREAATANRQIKESFEALGLDDPYGLLVIVTPPYRLDRHSIGWLIHDAVKGGTCRSINGIMIVETSIAAPNNAPSPRGSSLSFHSRDDRILSLTLRERIGRAWGEVTGERMIRPPVEEFFTSPSSGL